MTKEMIIVIVLAVALAIAIIAIIALAAALGKKRSGENTAARVKVVDGVRYSQEEHLTEDGQTNVTHREGDIVLQRGKSVKAVKNGALMPGSYTVLAVSERTETFKLRLGGLVREYKHGDTVVLGDGEEICAVSCSVILR